jgi:hypothetical protein
MFECFEMKYQGFFIALHACEVWELGDNYLGHYKIFTARRSDFWVPGHIAAGIAGELSPSAGEALADAKDLAMQHVRRLGAAPRTSVTAPGCGLFGL